MSDYSKEREAYNRLIRAMAALPAPRNINAVRAYVMLYKPELAPLIEPMARDAAAGSKPAQQLMLFMLAAFAAGRAYQDANPNAPMDPFGYE